VVDELFPYFSASDFAQAGGSSPDTSIWW